MRKKLFIGVFLIAVVSIAAGEYLFNRSGAQDAPKKATEEKKADDLFDVLKKDLEAKRDVPPPVLPTPVPKDGPPSFPALPSTLTIPPAAPKAPETKPADLQIPPPAISGLPPQNVPPIAPPPVVNAPTTPPAPQTVPPPVAPTIPQVAEPKKADPKPPQELVFPPATRDKYAKPDNSPAPLVAPPQDARYDSSDYPKQAFDNPVDPAKKSTKELRVGSDNGRTDVFESKPNTAPISQASVPLPKDCPWSLQVDMVEGQTTVIATVNKKHEFKIVCKSLDLQTAKGTLKASGKVTITGDAFNGTCDNLAIPLMEDRLVLDGGAAVTIQKLTSTVSDTKPAAFELKGETLNLRISELQREPFQQTSMRREIDVNVKQATATVADKQWTPYGTLRRVNGKLANDSGVWQLESRDGNVIAKVLARVGGTLTQHEGQTISVFGNTELIDGQRYLRVTHIALP